MCSHDSPIYVISYANKKGIYATTLPSEILKKIFYKFNCYWHSLPTLYLRPCVLIVYISSPIIIDEIAFRDSAEM